MQVPSKFTAALLVGALAATAALAQANPAVNARKAHMQLYAHNLGVLGGMARGNIDYDAAAATAAAGNLVELASIDQTSYWVAGTDSDSLPDESRALPALFDNLDDVNAKRLELLAASEALAATAGDGLEAVQAGLGPVGAVCGACHEAYQKPRG